MPKTILFPFVAAAAVLAIIIACDESNPVRENNSSQPYTIGVWAGEVPGDTVTMAGVTIDHKFIYTLISDSSFNVYDSLYISTAAGSLPPQYRKTAVGNWTSDGAAYIFNADSCLAQDQSFKPENCSGPTVGTISGNTITINGFGPFGVLVVTRQD